MIIMVCEFRREPHLEIEEGVALGRTDNDIYMIVDSSFRAVAKQPIEWWLYPERGCMTINFKEVK